MRFIFDERKTAQAAARLLEHAGGGMEFLRLLKLLYLADRKSFVETGLPISGDRWVAMRLGPVLSQTYARISGGSQESPWYDYVTEPSDAHIVSLKGVVEQGALSDFEARILDEVWEQFNTWTLTKLLKYVHDLPEWHDPGNSSKAIEPQEILRSEGFSEADIQDLTEELEQINSHRF